MTFYDQDGSQTYSESCLTRCDLSVGCWSLTQENEVQSFWVGEVREVYEVNCHSKTEFF